MSLFLSKKCRIIISFILLILLIILSLFIPACKKNTALTTPGTSDMSDSSNFSGSSNESTSGSSESETTGSNLRNIDTSKTDGIGGGGIHGSCKSGDRYLPIYNVDLSFKQDDKKYISISFDAAWGADDTIQILDILDKYNVKTTFFMTGEWVEKYPDMVKEIYNRGHDLGNHSENHKQMSKLSVAEQKEEIMSVYDKIKNLTGYDCFLFRPPYGEYDSTLITTTYACNHYPIEWDVDSLDWKDYGVDNIIKTVTQHKHLGNGSIILMHNGSKYTAQALDTLISNLIDSGYTFIPISELIIRENFHMDHTGCQIAD